MAVRTEPDFIHSTHKSHDGHNIIFVDVHDGIFPRTRCHCCSMKISPAAFYKCCKCHCNLHKICAELPLEIEHPLHPQHFLYLSPPPMDPEQLPRLRFQPSYHKRECDHCKQVPETYYCYYCKSCNFCVDLICASPPGFRIEHRIHEEHPLIPMREEALFLCRVCGTKHEGRPFLCNTCGIWMSRSCASLPTTLDLKKLDVEEMNYQDYHHHPLTLAYSLETLSHKYPQINQLKCHICAVGLDPRFGVYYCSRYGCTYFAHVRCATSTTESFMSILTPPAQTHQVDLSTNVVPLPVVNQFVSVVSYFKSKRAREFTSKKSMGFNHKHYFSLTLHDTLTDKDGLSVCNGCIQPISPPFYACNFCDFLVHKMCFKLPLKIEFLRGLFLSLDNYPTVDKVGEIFNLFHCAVCHRPSNGFRYIRFSKAQADTSILHKHSVFDVKCAFLPKSITHEAHSNHKLILSRRKYGPCPCCLLDDDPGEFIYRCDSCSFNLHPKCALYPGTVDHKYDKHPLRLTYKLKGQLSDEVYCEICELGLNQHAWFYHCQECDQSFHPTCIPPLDYLSNIKFGGTLKLDYHVHPLTFDRLILECPCGYCNKVIDVIKDGMAFHCKKCVKYKIHLECAKLLRANQQHNMSEIFGELRFKENKVVEPVESSFSSTSSPPRDLSAESSPSSSSSSSLLADTNQQLNAIERSLDNKNERSKSPISSYYPISSQKKQYKHGDSFSSMNSKSLSLCTVGDLKARMTNSVKIQNKKC